MVRLVITGATMSDVFWLQFFTFLTVAAGFGYQIYKARLDRKHDLEDRTAARQAMVKRHEVVVEKIVENTEVNAAALTAANTMNEKIAQAHAVATEAATAATEAVNAVVEINGHSKK